MQVIRAYFHEMLLRLQCSDFPHNERIFNLLWLYKKKIVNLLILVVFLEHLHLRGNKHFWRKYTRTTLYPIGHYQLWYKAFHLTISKRLLQTLEIKKRPDCNTIN